MPYPSWFKRPRGSRLATVLLAALLAAMLASACTTPQGRSGDSAEAGPSLPRQGYHLSLGPGTPARLFVYTDTGGG